MTYLDENELFTLSALNNSLGEILPVTPPIDVSLSIHYVSPPTDLPPIPGIDQLSRCKY
jgi:D-mannonate dehydratase